LLLIGPTPPKKKKSEGVLGFRIKNIEREKIIICQWVVVTSNLKSLLPVGFRVWREMGKELLLVGAHKYLESLVFRV
jgi:hypothetical protein